MAVATLMRKRRLVQPVVAYVWDMDHLGLPQIEIPAQDFWPDRELRTIDGVQYAWLDWNACPRWKVEGANERATRPDRELLACGHELPMRMQRNRKTWYVRPGRLCTICAMSI
jgi:hypothetical protein